VLDNIEQNKFVSFLPPSLIHESQNSTSVSKSKDSPNKPKAAENDSICPE